MRHNRSCEILSIHNVLSANEIVLHPFTALALVGETNVISSID